MKTKMLVSASFFILLSGCVERPEQTKGSGELRQQLFIQCMEMALRFEKPVTQLSLEDASYGDGVAEITRQCSNSAYHQAIHISISQ